MKGIRGHGDCVVVLWVCLHFWDGSMEYIEPRQILGCLQTSINSLPPWQFFFLWVYDILITCWSLIYIIRLYQAIMVGKKKVVAATKKTASKDTKPPRPTYLEMVKYVHINQPTSFSHLFCMTFVNDAWYCSRAHCVHGCEIWLFIPGLGQGMCHSHLPPQPNLHFTLRTPCHLSSYFLLCTVLTMFFTLKGGHHCSSRRCSRGSQPTNDKTVRPSFHAASCPNPIFPAVQHPC